MMSLAHSPARLMLYALLSSIEEDLRHFILLHTHGIEPREFLGTDLYERALERAHHEDELISASPSLEELLPFVDFGDHFKLINARRQQLPPGPASHVRDVTHRLEELIAVRNRVMHSRPLKGTDLTRSFEIAESLAAVKVGPWDRLRATLRRFQEDPTFVYGLRIPTPSSSDHEDIPNNLPTPDFDETGFVGREQIVDHVKKVLVGPYPVVTLVGEGGLGKTAVALKAAYDFLDDQHGPFEAIIWSSSRTHTLNATEIRRIEGSISNSLGMIRAVATELAGTQVEDPAAEVLEYLREFRILLILDNLETVLDQRMTSFLGQLPTGSKVLVTSRIGIGAFEFPIKLDPMSPGDAVTLMRSLARVRQVQDLVRCTNSQIERYCERLRNNPGFIKWFVAGVQAGQRPEVLLAKPDVFLDFCMSNVYEYLGDASKSVLRAMMAIPGETSQAELGYYAGLDGLELTQAINQLLRTNMVSAHYIPSGPTYDTVYQLTELARDYLGKYHPLASEEVRTLEKRRWTIVAAHEEIAAAGERDPYKPTTIHLRSPRDVVAARYLSLSLKASRRGAYEEAKQLVDKAKGLAPEYFEVHRVEAMISADAGKALEARNAFGVAIELSSEHAPLRYFFGRFLMVYMDDVQAAAREFEAALSRDPDALRVQIELARANLYLGKYDVARDALLRLHKSNLALWDQRSVADLLLQTYIRQADGHARSREYARALESLEDARGFFSSLRAELIDPRLRERVRKAELSASWVEQWAEEQGGEIRERAERILHWLREQIGERPAGALGQEGGPRNGGVIYALPLTENYGFIRTETGQDFFFHRQSLEEPAAWEALSIGATVSFEITMVDGAPQATGVRVEAPGKVIRDELGQELQGIILTLNRSRGFGFVRAFEGPSYFFHRSMVATVADWLQLDEEKEVTFEVGINPIDGRTCARNVRLTV